MNDLMANDFQIDSRSNLPLWIQPWNQMDHRLPSRGTHFAQLVLAGPAEILPSLGCDCSRKWHSRIGNPHCKLNSYALLNGRQASLNICICILSSEHHITVTQSVASMPSTSDPTDSFVKCSFQWLADAKTETLPGGGVRVLFSKNPWVSVRAAEAVLMPGWSGATPLTPHGFPAGVQLLVGRGSGRARGRGDQWAVV